METAILHTQKRPYSLNTHPWTSIGRFSWQLLSIAMAPHRYILKRIAKRWRPNNVITSIGLGFTIFFLVTSDKFFVVIYTFLSLVLTTDFCYSQKIFLVSDLKKTKKKQISKNEMKHSGKREFIKERWWGHTFKL